MKNILLGISVKPDGTVNSEPFYCGHDGVALRKKHAELVKKNESGLRFFQIQNPILTPLQNVIHDTTNHPDIVAAQKRREELAKANSKTSPEPKTHKS